MTRFGALWCRQPQEADAGTGRGQVMRVSRPEAGLCESRPAPDLRVMRPPSVRAGLWGSDGPHLVRRGEEAGPEAIAAAAVKFPVTCAQTPWRFSREQFGWRGREGSCARS